MKKPRLLAQPSHQRVSRSEFEAALGTLRVDLLNMQFDLQSADFSVLVVIAGTDRAGCEQVLDVLQAWMDARHIESTVYENPREEEEERPRFWRYWRQLPPRGRIAVWMDAYASLAQVDDLMGRLDEAGLARRLRHIRGFEQALIDDGTLALKFYLHLPRAALADRLRSALDDPPTVAVSSNDWALYQAYDSVVRSGTRVLEGTHTRKAPWRVTETDDARFRDLRVAQTILAEVQKRLRNKRKGAKREPERKHYSSSLHEADLERKVPKRTYQRRLRACQSHLRRLSEWARAENLSSVLVFEGSDAAGKGGSIRRLTAAMPARNYHVVRIAAPTEEERVRHYLWRFWRHLPRAGCMTIFDRSWYGRVLVERVEGFASPAEWDRAYDEMGDFEDQLVESGIVVRKFWLTIDAEEQLRRFKAREKTPYKRHKITDEDYRNRARWDDYAKAVDEMVARTSTENAPWLIVPANDKRAARLQVLEAVIEAIEQAHSR